MRVPVEWLKEYVTIRLSPEALAARLTMAGLEVVAVRDEHGQPVLDLEVTPNRADCLSILGVAREVAAITGQRLTRPLVHGSGSVVRGKGRRPTTKNQGPRTDAAIRIEDHRGCQRYIGRLLEGVAVGPSPAWMQRRLAACGTRPINNVADITNYVLFECGQPLHAFDFDRLAEATILVRRAKPDEPITTLDGVRRALSAETLVIADAQRPVAIAGVMGGTGTEITDRTTRVLLESALFDPVTVRRTARRLGLMSESSYRFERGVDPAGVEAASRRAAQLIIELAGGREAAVRDVGAAPPKRTMITVEAPRLSRWLGVRVESPAIRTMLARLSCRVASTGSSGTLRVQPPSFRHDVTQEVDVYEEVARLFGYDRVPATVPFARLAEGSPPGTFGHAQSLRCFCASLGLTEAITWALVSEAELARCGYAPSQTARLANPLSQEHAYLRPSLLMGMLQTVRRNLAQGAEGVRLFEIGSVTRPSRPAQPEQLFLGVALAGMWTRDWRGGEACDFFKLKGCLEAVFNRLCEGGSEWVPASPAWAEPGQAAEIRLRGRAVGVAGQVSRAIAHALDVEQPVWFGEVSVAELLQARRASGFVRVPSGLPPVKRDLSFLIADEMPYAEVLHAIRENGGAALARAALIDQFTGKQVPPGQRSLTVSLEYRDPSRTLTAAEADVIHQRIGQALVSRLGAQLR